MRLRLPQSTPMGLAPGKREYDLPFKSDRANRFLVMLITLMTFLAVLSAAGGLVLTQMAARWSEGLQNQITIEIPGVAATGIRLTPTEKQEMVEKVRVILAGDRAFSNVKVMKEQEIQKLVEPWLGQGDALLDQVALPSLVTAELAANDDQAVKRLTQNLKTAVAGARVETHQGWLRDVLRLTSSLSFTAYLIGLITAITTVSAVGGAVRARMAAYQEQLEILHLIGAEDFYITRQFSRHAMELSLLGASMGFLLAMATLGLIDQLSGTVQTALVPHLILNSSSFIVLMLIPALTCLLTVVTTRLTVLQTLREMP